MIVAGVLEGIRVLDFGRFIAASLCAALLADIETEAIRFKKIYGEKYRGIHPLGRESYHGPHV